MSYAEQVKTTFADSASNDAFGRIRVSNPTTLFSSSFLYDKQPLVFEELTTGSGTATYDANDSSVLLETTGTGTDAAALQSYKRAMYQPGKSHLAEITFVMGTGIAGVVKQVGLGDIDEGFFLQQSGTTISIEKKSITTVGDESVTQDNWNIDPFDGTGPSGITLDFTHTQILIMDMQWLGVGRVRIGFSVDGKLYPAHEFNHANNTTHPYTSNLVLPVRYSISSTDASSSLRAICSSVQSEGGTNTEEGYNFSRNGDVIAANGTRTHLLSLQPKLLFNSKTNRSQLNMHGIDILVTGASPVYWELCIGTSITGTTTFNDVNSTYSAVEYNTAGTYDAMNGIVVDSGYINTVDKSSATISSSIASLFPLVLNAAGEHRPDNFDRITLLVTGIGGTSQTYASVNWEERR